MEGFWNSITDEEVFKTFRVKSLTFIGKFKRFPKLSLFDNIRNSDYSPVLNLKSNLDDRNFVKVQILNKSNFDLQPNTYYRITAKVIPQKARTYHSREFLLEFNNESTFELYSPNEKEFTELVFKKYSEANTANSQDILKSVKTITYQINKRNETFIYELLQNADDYLRPYQYFATEAIIKQVSSGNDNGYIWHTTGSGKTLTSFKASQIIMDLPNVHKVVFVVDRKDLDYQTMQEFNSFKKGSVDVTDNTSTLVKQLTDDTKLVLTTIQKLNNAITKGHYENKLSHLKDKKIVFIFDECHRSQFGDTHDRIIKYFHKSQLFGFTGTPIFADNANKNELGKRTTKDLFGSCLHKYVITDAIRDQNVLKFGIEYIGRYKQKGNTFIDIEVEDIDKEEVFNDPKRFEKIVDYILAYHDQKTFGKEYSSLFAVSSIANLIKYYEIFKRKKNAGEHVLRLATIFTFGANEDDDDAQDYLPVLEELPMAADPAAVYKSSHTRDKLEEFIGDYNKMYETSFSTKDSEQFENYFKDISKRVKNRELPTFKEGDRLDIILVVNMLLTGFDAKKLNTLYVDKNLKYHGLIQAFSRTNRIFGEQKSQGNILCFRNLKARTDEAITLFSNKEAIEEIILPPYEVIAKIFDAALKNLLQIAPTYKSVDDLESEEDELKFIQAFRALMRAKNVLGSYTDFSWDDLGIDEQKFEYYKSKYLDLYDKVKQDHIKQKTSILDDIDFELELIHRDIINVAYILKLLAKLKQTKSSESQKQKKAIIDLLSGEVELRSKRELIEKFIEENLPSIHDAGNIQDEFEKYWQEQKVLALAKLCEEENLDKEQFKALEWIAKILILYLKKINYEKLD